MSESVKPDGIDLMAYLDNYCIPLVGAEAQIVKLCQQFANRQHLVLTADLRQEIEGRRSLEKELTESYERELSGIKAEVTALKEELRLSASEEDLVDTLASYQKLVEEYRRVNQELRDNLKAQSLEGSK